jgi:small subunit ribosomal protein S21
MTKVIVRNGNFEGAFKRFKNDSAKSGVFSEYKKREHYTKPGVEKREAKKNAIKNSKKKSKTSEGRRDY